MEMHPTTNRRDTLKALDAARAGELGTLRAAARLDDGPSHREPSEQNRAFLLRFSEELTGAFADARPGESVVGPELATLLDDLATGRHGAVLHAGRLSAPYATYLVVVTDGGAR